MPKIEIKTDILAPEHIKYLSYEGPHPSRLLKEIREIVKNTFQIESPQMFEDNFRWDNFSEPNEFYAIWRGKDAKDERTVVWPMVYVHGFQKSDDLTGSAVVYIRGTMITKFPYSTPFHKLAFLIYTWLYYNNVRRDYLREARERLRRVEDDIRELLGLMQRVREVGRA